MTKSADNELTLATKVNRLFEVYRARHETEQTDHDVAMSISRIIGKPVSVDEVRALRRDADTAPDPDLIDGLIVHFAVPPEYLKTAGTRAKQLDTQLRLLAAARDAGVKRLALRGAVLDAGAIDVVLDIVKEIPAEDA
jgi:hypothetical protein